MSIALFAGTENGFEFCVRMHFSFQKQKNLKVSANYCFIRNSMATQYVKHF